MYRGSGNSSALAGARNSATMASLMGISLVPAVVFGFHLLLCARQSAQSSHGFSQMRSSLVWTLMSSLHRCEISCNRHPVER